MAGDNSGDSDAAVAPESGETRAAAGKTIAEGARERAPETGARGVAWRWRPLWAAAIVVVAGLFTGFLAISRTFSLNSDGAGEALQGWDMLHGNLLLHGWWTSDVSFWTFEMPVDAVVEAVRGLGGDVVHITAAVVYTLVLLTGMLLARGNLRGQAGVAAAAIAGAILLAPADGESAGILLGSPDHIGVAAPIMVTLLFVDRVRERWWVPLVTLVLLVWAQLDDPIAEFAAAFALAVVCLARAALGLVRRQGRAAWYDAALGAAAIVSYGLTRLTVGLVRAAGGLSMRQLKQATQFQSVSHWPHQLHNTLHNTLLLFGADFFEQSSRILTAATLVHLIGAVLAAIGLLAGIVSLVRRADRVTQTLTVGTLVTLGAGAFVTAMEPGYDAHEIAVVLPFGAVLAGRTIGPWLVRRRITRVALAPAVAALLAAYLAFFGYYAARPPVPARTQTLDDFLVSHHLTDGIGRYWTGSSTRLITGNQVRIAPVDPGPKRPYPWITKPSWYDASAHTANFVVAGTDPEGGLVFSSSAVVKAFGKPAREYRFGHYIIMVYGRNLLRELDKPVQPNPDTGGFRL